MFVYRDTPTHTLVDELGIALVPFLPASYGIHLDGVTVVSRDNDDLVDRLPLPAPARLELRTFIHQALSEYRRYTVGGRLVGTSDDLRQSSTDAHLAGLPPRVRAILEAAIQGGSVAKPSQLTAQYALRYFASYLAHEQGNRLLAVDGMHAGRECLVPEQRFPCGGGAAEDVPVTDRSLCVGGADLDVAAELVGERGPCR